MGADLAALAAGCAAFPIQIRVTTGYHWQESHPERKHWASAVFPGIIDGMILWLTLALHLAVARLKSRRSLLLELLALQHQLLVLSRSTATLTRASWVVSATAFWMNCKRSWTS